jgi:hypothetical protein
MQCIRACVREGKNHHKVFAHLPAIQEELRVRFESLRRRMKLSDSIKAMRGFNAGKQVCKSKRTEMNTAEEARANREAI